MASARAGGGGTGRIATVAAALVCLALAGCGDAGPDAQLQSIRKLKAENPPLSPAQKATVSRAVTAGKAALAAGDTDMASENFDRALDILEFARDTEDYDSGD